MFWKAALEKKRPANILCFMNPNAPFSMLRAIKIYDTELITTNLLTLPTLVTYQNNKKGRRLASSSLLAFIVASLSWSQCPKLPFSGDGNE